MSKEEKFKTARYFAIAITIPFMMMSTTLVGYFLGVFFDSLFNTSPYGKLVLVFLGVTAGIMETWKAIKKLQRFN